MSFVPLRLYYTCSNSNFRSDSKPRRSKKEEGILNIEDVVCSNSMATSLHADDEADIIVEKVMNKL